MVGRADVLAGVFYISAILVYINAVLLKEMKYSGLFASLSLCLCSALSKEIGITAVALCLGYEYFIHRKVCYVVAHGGSRPGRFGARVGVGRVHV